MGSTPRAADLVTERALRASVAFVWLATGLLVAHPFYREIGASYLAPLGVGPWLMVATCAGEVVLAGIIVSFRSSTLLAVAQTAAVAVFTVILAVLDPMLLVHPLGVLTKNLPLLAVVWTAWLVSREGFTPRAERLLTIGMALIWLTEGILPKVLFQQRLELDIVESFGFSQTTASHMIRATGVLQALAGLGVLFLRGKLRPWLLWGLAAALVVLPLMVTVPMPLLWAHPFGPLTKTVPILVGTIVLARRCTPTSS